MANDDADGQLDRALGSFDKVEANLAKLERLWAELQGQPTPSRERQDEIVMAYGAIKEYLPSIDGLTLDSVPMTYDEIEALRLEVQMYGEAEDALAASQAQEAPGADLRLYRFHFDNARKKVVRDRIIEVVGTIDAMLTPLSGGEEASAEQWERLAGSVTELDRLVGADSQRSGRWGDLRRHLHYRTSVDLHDIVTLDWPSVRSGINANLYDDDEPIPVHVDDLADLVRSRPKGPVSTELAWSSLRPEDFERLIFELVRSSDGYENVDWLMRTNAADKGRDVSAERVIVDPLSGTTRFRVIIQCKHWQARSVNLNDLTACLNAVSLWEPPLVDVLIVASSGRFTQDAVALAEKRQAERAVPRVELWPESHIEALLASRSHLVMAFKLRPGT